MGSGYVRDVFLFRLLPNSGPINWLRSSAGQEPRISPFLLEMVDISGLLDWESTGWYPVYWEFTTELRFGKGSWWFQVAPWIVIVEIVKRGPVNYYMWLVLPFLV